MKLGAFGAAAKRYWKYVQVLFVGLAFLLIGVALYASWSDLASFEWKLDYSWFLVSLAVITISALSVAAWWTLSVRLLHGRLGWRQGFRIWAFSQIAKYLPGGIWNYATRVIASDRVGIPKGCTTMSLLIEMVLRVQAAIVVFLVSLPFWPRIEWSGIELLPLVVVLLLGAVVLYPRVLNWCLNLLLRILHKPPVAVPLQYRYILGLLVCHVLTVAGCGVAFYLMVRSAYYLPSEAILPLAGMFAFAVISGFLNPLTPHGLGTREGLLSLFLGYYLPLPVAIFMSLLSRLWLTVSEALGILLAAFMPATRD